MTLSPRLVRSSGESRATQAAARATAWRSRSSRAESPCEIPKIRLARSSSCLLRVGRPSSGGMTCPALPRPSLAQCSHEEAMRHHCAWPPPSHFARWRPWMISRRGRFTCWATKPGQSLTTPPRAVTLTTFPLRLMPRALRSADPSRAVAVPHGSRTADRHVHPHKHRPIGGFPRAAIVA